MYKYRSTHRPGESLDSRHDSENQTDHYSLIGKTLRLPNGSRVLLIGVQDTPRERWLNIRPGGWIPARWLLDL